ncbi:MAG: AAA family ATPase [Phycisphaerales bacterium]|nr:AAA family ATPase [Phycisphaerales bacterium]
MPERKNTLFPNSRRHAGVRAVITGQVGVDKKPFLARVAAIAQSKGHPTTVCHVGDMMYAEAPDVAPGRILDLPRPRLDSLRRSVFKDILRTAEQTENLLVNTHATFRWKHGLFPAFDHDQMTALDADLYITLVDNVDAIHERLIREHDVPHTLKDILVWREEEILATEVMSRIIRGHGCFFVVSRGVERDTALSVYRLLFERNRRKVYPSFPMTHVINVPQILTQIDLFRNALTEHFITFDPGDMDEKRLLYEAGAATQRGERQFNIEVNNRRLTFSVDQVTSVADDIDGQIYARDFKLIDQSDMIVSFIPELPDGRPALSSGVERELQHAFEATREVYVIWPSRIEPSPFITETATEVFPSLEHAFRSFQKRGYVGEYQLPLNHHSAPPNRGLFG